MLFSRRKYTTITVRKKDLPGGLWVKCQHCAEIVYKQEIETNHGVCPNCEYHFPIRWKERLDITIDPGFFSEWDCDLVSSDPLSFTGQSSYLDKLRDSRNKSGMKDAIVCGQAKINAMDVALGIMDFSFLGGSMGSVVGEKVTRLLERAAGAKMPVIIFVATGGARMYEGMFSLMQMAKTSAAVARHAAARLPYIVVLTHPSTAGVMASYGTLGDIIIAEPFALIGFAGPRVIKETTREDVPKGFQRSEFVLQHGLIDMIVHRNELKKTLGLLLGYMAEGTKAHSSIGTKP
jgi:acetyl-CoA carboxylase carboxyl transferase subunit beta